MKRKLSAMPETTKEFLPENRNPLQINSEEEIAKALLLSDGQLTNAAKNLGCSLPTLSQRIKDSKYLQLARIEAKEVVLDLAESKLKELINAADFQAIKFYLTTQGKERGFQKTVNNNHNVSGGIVLIPQVIKDKNEWQKKAIKQQENLKSLENIIELDNAVD